MGIPREISLIPQLQTMIVQVLHFPPCCYGYGVIKCKRDDDDDDGRSIFQGNEEEGHIKFCIGISSSFFRVADGNDQLEEKRKDEQ